MSKKDIVATKTQEIDPKAQERKEARQAAKKRVLEFVNQNRDQLGSIAGDIMLFVGKATASGTKAAPRTVNTDLRNAFLERGSLTEMDIFKMFKIGRPEMVTKCRILVLCPNPADRVWVKFNEATETYNVVGTGENPPDDWDGYVPSAKTL